MRPGGFGAQALGVVAGGDEQDGGGVDPHAEELEQVRRRRLHELGESLVEVRGLLFEGVDPAPQAGEGHLRGRDHRVAPDPDPQGGGLGDEVARRQAFEAASKLVGGRVTQLAHLVDGAEATLSSRTLGDDQRPDGLDVAVPGLRGPGAAAAQHSPGRLDSIGGIGFAFGPAHLAVGPVDLDHLDAGASEEPSEPGSIGAGALHAHLGDRPESAHPLEHGRVALGRGHERLHSEHAADGVQGRGHMDIEVGVDTTDNGAASFYDGHCHPCSPLVKGWRGRPVKEVTVISALHEQGGPSPLWNGARRSWSEMSADRTT